MKIYPKDVTVTDWVVKEDKVVVDVDICHQEETLTDTLILSKVDALRLTLATGSVPEDCTAFRMMDSVENITIKGEWDIGEYTLVVEDTHLAEETIIDILNYVEDTCNGSIDQAQKAMIKYERIIDYNEDMLGEVRRFKKPKLE